MKTRAAVAFARSSRSRSSSSTSRGPKAGEVLVEIMATGICHTDAYTLDGLDSEGHLPLDARPRGRRRSCARSAPGVTCVKPGDHVIPLYTPECRQCKSCLRGKTNLCTAIRATQGKGLMPDGTSRFSYKGETIFHYMGCSTFSNFTVLPEIAVAKIREDAPFKTSLLHRLRRHHRGRRGGQHRQGRARRQRASCSGSAGSGSTCIQGAQHGRAPTRSSASTSIPAREEWGRKFGMTDFVNRKEHGPRGHRRPARRADRRRRRLHLRLPPAIPTVMRTALECCHRGWGTIDHHRRGRGGQGNRHPPVPAGHRPRLARHRVRRRRGRTDVPKIVDWYMDGKIEIDPMITHSAHARRDQQGLRPDARGRKHPQRRGVLNYGFVIASVAKQSRASLSRPGLPRPLRGLAKTRLGRRH